MSVCACTARSRFGVNNGRRIVTGRRRGTSAADGHDTRGRCSIRSNDGEGGVKSMHGTRTGCSAGEARRKYKRRRRPIWNSNSRVPLIYIAFHFTSELVRTRAYKQTRVLSTHTHTHKPKTTTPADSGDRVLGGRNGKKEAVAL